ncbi:MAG: DEAD/DEAH box helicase [Bacillota bacterium]|nr:DEAD/DEAH box helicase [Bacillota bacterium]
MNSKQKAQLTNVNKIPLFKETMKKLTLEEELTNKEKTYLLSVAIIFIKSFESDSRNAAYLEFAYYIILKYSTTYHDYRPLYDFAINFGFYPIAKEINQKELLPDIKLADTLAGIQLDEYRHENYTETLEQKQKRINLLNSNDQHISYIAPTSFGKSSLIFEHIKNNLGVKSKIAIIVPTKSLLVQTYRLLRKANLKRKIIIHDEMYRKEESFVGVLTQERALRLLEKNEDIAFDILYIDEAHNLFEKSPRSILLSRLLRYNARRNNKQKTIYLSPLINKSNNLRLDFQDNIVEQKIEYNMKEPEIYEYRENQKVFIYNRFVNEFYPSEEIRNEKNEAGYITYIKLKRGNKNFIYHMAPRKIEEFSKEFYSNLPDKKLTSSTEKLIKELEELVHKDFYVIELLKKGIIYLHGRMPDSIKEYLEFQFKTNSDLNYAIANKVILEGINLPIDTLFIMHSNGLKEKQATNLIGRVNRLNEIFNVESNQLNRLLPQVHFLNSKYNKQGNKMENLIKKLRSNIFLDKIENPILVEFDIDKIKKESVKEKIQIIKENEDFILTESLDELENLKRLFIRCGLESLVSIDNKYLEKVIKRIEFCKKSSLWKKMNIVQKVYILFICKIERTTISDYAIYRLKYKKARNYYRGHLARRSNSLKENINSTYSYFKRRIKDGSADLYIGISYGEKAIRTENYQDRIQEVFVDLSTKNDAELINLAIIKLKIEDDFISYKLNRLIVVLYELNLITEEEYNDAIYGTNDNKKIDLLKTGLSFSLIARLQKDEQLKNINLDENNNLEVNVDFLEYKNNLNGFYQFEMEKYFSY